MEVKKVHSLIIIRIRPLTANMKKYAREDTHFLLYISDELRTLLLQQSNETNLVSICYLVIIIGYGSITKECCSL